MTAANPDKILQRSSPARWQRSAAGRLLLVFGIAFLVVAITRMPFFPAHLFSFDSVNFALALRDFDPTRNQPQPPGYPLFILEARLLALLFGSPESTFQFLGLLVSALSVGMLYLLGRRMFSPWVGLVAAALLFVNPPFWYAGLTSPLRPHLALISISVAYCCWRFLEGPQGESRYFYLAALFLALGGGFRPEMLLFLLPLFAWTAGRRGQRLLLGLLILGAVTVAWGLVVVNQTGGLRRVLPAFSQYFFSQTQDTSLLLDAPFNTLRRNLGRAVIWTGLGALPWIWTLPFGWRSRGELPAWKRRLHFLALWFFPGFLFHFFVHIADPDHALSTIPALCLLGAYCLVAAEQALGRIWSPELRDRGIAIWIALVGNAVLFLGEFPIPQRPPGVQFRGLQSVSDAFYIGLYESSARRVRWVEQMTQQAFEQIQILKAATNRPVTVVWARDGEPAWRKICFYFPGEKVYALDARGDPGVPDSQARLWSGNTVLSSHSGALPLRLPVPPEGRLIWVIAPASVEGLSQVVSLQRAPPLYYTDLPADTGSFRWGSFEFVPQ